MSLLPLVSPITTIATQVFNLASNYLGNKADQQQQAHLLKLKADETVTRILEKEQDFQTAWTIAQAKKADHVLRRASFTILVAPLVVGIVYPDQVLHYFDNVLGKMPEWYIVLLSSVFAAIWAIASFQNFRRK